MSNKLSIISADENINLQNSKTDIGVTLAKAVLSFVPLGSFLGETLNSVIPNQRVDRIALGIEVLNQKLKYLPENVLQKLRGEYSEMLYEVITQLSKTRTEDRRNYLASLLKNSLTDEELEQIEKEKLLQLLGQLNDAEIVLLKYHSIIDHDERAEYFSRYENLLNPIKTDSEYSQAVLQKLDFFQAYKNRLIDLGLETPVFTRINKGELPAFDEKTGMIKATDSKITALGLLFLRYIGLHLTHEQQTNAENTR